MALYGATAPGQRARINGLLLGFDGPNSRRDLRDLFRRGMGEENGDAFMGAREADLRMLQGATNRPGGMEELGLLDQQWMLAQPMARRGEATQLMAFARTNLGLGALAVTGAGTGLEVSGGNTRLTDTGATAATYGDATHALQVTVDAKGRITAISAVEIDVPAGATAGGVLDIWQQPITDMGQTGPDKGAGGKYLILPPGYEGPVPEGGFYVARSRTTRVLILGRMFMENDNPAPAVEAIRKLKG